MTPEQQIKKLNKEIAKLKKANEVSQSSFHFHHQLYLDCKGRLAEARE